MERVLGALINLTRLSDVPFGKGLHGGWHFKPELTISGLLRGASGGGLGSSITRPGGDLGSAPGSYIARLADGHFGSGLAICNACFLSSNFRVRLTMCMA